VQRRSGRTIGSRVFGWIEPEVNPAATIYGTIAVGLVIAAEDPAKETYGKVVLATTVTVAVYWLAHSYAQWLGGRLRGKEDPGRDGLLLMHALRKEWTLVEGAMAPVLSLGVCWSAGVPLTTGVAAALWTAAGALLLFEFVAGIRRRLPPLHLVGNAVVGASMGAALFVVKLLLH
jgi:hypothetical protein